MLCAGSAERLLLLLVITAAPGVVDMVEEHKYCVIGAGPAGLQLAYYLEQWKLDYIVLERNLVAGEFYFSYCSRGCNSLENNIPNYGT